MPEQQQYGQPGYGPDYGGYPQEGQYGGGAAPDGYAAGYSDAYGGAPGDGYPQAYAGPEQPQAYAPEYAPPAPSGHPAEGYAGGYGEPAPGPGGYPPGPTYEPAYDEGGATAYAADYTDYADVDTAQPAGPDGFAGLDDEYDRFDRYEGHEGDAGHDGHDGHDQLPTVPEPRRAEPAGTAAERAARRVPIWHPPGLVPALLTGGVAAVVAAGALVGGAGAAVGVAVLQVLTAAGWFRLHGMWPARQGIALAALAGLAADAVVLNAGDDALRTLPGVMAVVLGVALLQQLARRDGRPELMSALTVTATAALLTVLDVLYVLAARVEGPDVRDGAVVVVGVAAAALAVLVAALPLPGVIGETGGLAAAAAVGFAAGGAFGLGTPGLALGTAAGLLALMGRRTAGYDHPSKFVHMTAGVALPVALAAPAVYLLGRVAIG
ncbi:hypothetical protein [Yinghuangia seranimata]|uniref:hypothetical protein n=1 Tax=Yinghuangia seranimata TaxID=408067 RepID=UPI00248C37AD|nr:hypothetical protein [Yinghuangia seranimata]MDI2131746.1 hypothetical protein [Yinghuangia seranimata]